MANNNNQQQNKQVDGQQQVPQVEVPQQQPVVQQPVQTQVVVEKPNWLKQHWKGLAAAGAAILTTLGVSKVAYNKGKAAGINSVPLPPQDDYSLNPNE